MTTEEEAGAVRLDKWLWAARFFKTRGLAVEAINGGHVHLNGVRVKPARLVHVGDELSIRKSGMEFVVMVEQCAERRGPAVEAQRLYRETDESRQLRERLAEERRLQAASAPVSAGRPDKKGRRQIIRFTGKGG